MLLLPQFYTQENKEQDLRSRSNKDVDLDHDSSAGSTRCQFTGDVQKLWVTFDMLLGTKAPKVISLLTSISNNPCNLSLTSNTAWGNAEDLSSACMID